MSDVVVREIHCAMNRRHQRLHTLCEGKTYQNAVFSIQTRCSHFTALPENVKYGQLYLSTRDTTVWISPTSDTSSAMRCNGSDEICAIIAGFVSSRFRDIERYYIRQKRQSSLRLSRAVEPTFLVSLQIDSDDILWLKHGLKFSYAWSSVLEVEHISKYIANVTFQVFNLSIGLSNQQPLAKVMDLCNLQPFEPTPILIPLLSAIKPNEITTIRFRCHSREETFAFELQQPNLDFDDLLELKLTDFIKETALYFRAVQSLRGIHPRYDISVTLFSHTRTVSRSNTECPPHADEYFNDWALDIVKSIISSCIEIHNREYSHLEVNQWNEYMIPEVHRVSGLPAPICGIIFDYTDSY